MFQFQLSDNRLSTEGCSRGVPGTNLVAEYNGNGATLMILISWDLNRELNNAGDWRLLRSAKYPRCQYQLVNVTSVKLYIETQVLGSHVETGLVVGRISRGSSI